MSETSNPSPAARTYTVRGMTCGHCVSSVTEEVSEIDGVERIRVELESGRVVVHGSGFTDEHVLTAITDAGYELAP